MKTTTQLPLDQLRPAADDIRDHRPEGQVRSIANSMGDPDVGQLQPVLAFPVGWADLQVDSADDLEQLVRDGHTFEILDGTTRYLAARDHLKWDRLWTWIHDQPPDNQQIARLDANTERISMTEYETVKAICSYRNDHGLTWEEVGDETGWSPSYLSNVNRALNGPDWLLEPWQDPELPVSTSIVIRLMTARGPKFRDQIQEVSGMDEAEAEARADRFAQQLLEWTLEFDWSPSELDKAIKQRQRELLDELQSGTPGDDPQTAAEKESADQLHGAPVNVEDDPTPCLICGREAATKVAIDVCPEDRGLLTDQQAKGEPLMAPQEAPQDDQAPDLEAAAELLGVDPDGLRQALTEP